jgi:hypothetical protein
VWSHFIMSKSQCGTSWVTVEIFEKTFTEEHITL